MPAAAHTPLGCAGEHRLIAVNKLTKPENYLEFFILQAVATPVK